MTSVGRQMRATIERPCGDLRRVSRGEGKCAVQLRQGRTDVDDAGRSLASRCYSAKRTRAMCVGQKRTGDRSRCRRICTRLGEGTVEIPNFTRADTVVRHE